MNCTEPDPELDLDCVPNASHGSQSAQHDELIRFRWSERRTRFAIGPPLTETYAMTFRPSTKRGACESVATRLLLKSAAVGTPRTRPDLEHQIWPGQAQHSRSLGGGGSCGGACSSSARRSGSSRSRVASPPRRARGALSGWSAVPCASRLVRNAAPVAGSYRRFEHQPWTQRVLQWVPKSQVRRRSPREIAIDAER